MNQLGGLSATALRKRHPGAEHEVLAGVELHAAPGEAVAVLGPSGSGKSTLLACLGTLDRPDAGSVALDGADLLALRGAALAAARARLIGLVFQDHHLLPHLTALENVLLPAGRGQEAHARELLERLGLAARAHAHPAALSGGERQRVAVARALVNRPRLLLCDEPTGSLDRELASAVGDELLALARAAGAVVVVATHDAALASRCDRRMGLAGGRLEPCA